MSQVSYQHLVLLHGVCMAGDSERQPPYPRPHPHPRPHPRPHPCPSSWRWSIATLRYKSRARPGWSPHVPQGPSPCYLWPSFVTLGAAALGSHQDSAPQNYLKSDRPGFQCPPFCSFARAELPLQAPVPPDQYGSYLPGAQDGPGAALGTVGGQGLLGQHGG